MKHEYRKHEKEIYVPKQKPELIRVPKFKYVTISGKGNPNTEEFSNKIGVLYQLSYAIRMMPRNGYTPEGYFEYTVYPLEGLWDLSKDGRLMDKLDKNELVYKIMIRQPDFVTDDVFNKALENVKKKNDSPLLDEVKFISIEDGSSVQMLHVGSYDDESKTFDIMKHFIKDNNLELKTLVHKEIYLSDFRKVEQDKLKTVLRYFVK